MKIMDALTAEDKALISNWIKYNTSNVKGEQCSIEYLLRFWAEEKQYLFEMFGEKLILEEPVNFEGSIEGISYFIGKESGSDISSPLYIFRSNYYKFLSESANPYVCSQKYKLMDLINESVLAENSVRHETFVVIENGIKITIEKGSKAIKVLGKLAKIFNIEGFEEFRIRHSQILNSAKLKGTLCLSIHPLDFMTMSDNDSNWSTCMAWRNDEGCHKQGTVEMMNSPYVVIAYVKSSKDMKMPGYGSWNNKKWRELFIVDDSIITEIKPYPYIHHQLTELILNKLKNLRGPDCYSEEIINHPGDLSPVKFNYFINFLTTYMYNDFGAIDYHSAYVNKYIESGESINIYYSGMSECMWCGEEIDDGEYDSAYEEALVCRHCQEGYYCIECGNWVKEPYFLESDEEFENPYCMDCFYSLTFVDVVDNAHHYNQQANTIYVIPDAMTEQEIIKDAWYPYFWSFTTSHFDDLFHYKQYFTEDAKIVERNYSSCFRSYWREPQIIIRPIHTIKLSHLTDEGLKLIYSSREVIEKISKLFIDRVLNKKEPEDGHWEYVTLDCLQEFQSIANIG